MFNSPKTYYGLYVLFLQPPESDLTLHQEVKTHQNRFETRIVFMMLLKENGDKAIKKKPILHI